MEVSWFCSKFKLEMGREQRLTNHENGHNKHFHTAVTDIALDKLDGIHAKRKSHESNYSILNTEQEASLLNK